MPRLAKHLNEIWKVNANHCLYHKDGKWYHILKSFPGALFDRNGYILFKTKNEFQSCRHLKIGEEVNVRGHISGIPGYIRVK